MTSLLPFKGEGTKRAGRARGLSRARPFRGAAGLAGCLLLGVPLAPAHAYVRSLTSKTQLPLFWRHPCVRLTLLVDSLPGAVSADLFRTAAREAGRAWSTPQVACTRTDVSVEDDERSQRFSEADDVNSLQFLQEFWGRNARDASQRRPYDPFALAITSVWAKPSTGEITEADIEFNGLGPPWGDLEADPEAGTDGSSHDLQNVLTHELGHVLGLDHTCDAGGQTNWTDHRGDPVGACPAPPETEGPTMVGSIQPGDLARRTLEEDEQLAMCDLYPAEGAPSCPKLSQNAEGGCALGTRPTGRGGALPFLSAVLWAAAFAWRRKRKKARF